MMEDALQKLQMEMEKVGSSMWQPQDPLSPPTNLHSWLHTPIAKEQLGTENAIMRLEARKRLSSPEFGEQRRARQSLPAWMERRKIVDAVSSQRVIVLTGETGCGKTTQVCHSLKSLLIFCIAESQQLVISIPDALGWSLFGPNTFKSDVAYHPRIFSVVVTKDRHSMTVVRHVRLMRSSSHFPLCLPRFSLFSCHINAPTRVDLLMYSLFLFFLMFKCPRCPNLSWRRQS